MKTKTLEINGHSIPSTNQCSVQYREDAATMIKYWDEARIRAYLAEMDEPEVLRKELNELKGKAK